MRYCKSCGKFMPNEAACNVDAICELCTIRDLQKELAKAQAQNARLRDLLGPTEELLKDGVLSWEGEGPAVSQTRFKAELARIREAMNQTDNEERNK